MNRNKNLVTILLVINIILLIALAGAIVYIFMNVNNDTGENIIVDNDNTINVENKVEDNEEEEEEETVDEAERTAIETFNAIFKSYEGTELSSAQIRALLSQIEINNTNEERKITLKDTGITQMEQVEDDKKYNVELSYDDAGYVNEINIIDPSVTPIEDENNENTSADLDKLIFNTKFTSYLGDITGERLNSLLMTIQNSNGTNPEHQITLSSNNLSDLNGIVATDIYTIQISYDSNGYVGNINIDKKIQ